jgi:hypothetical protein
LKIDHFKLVGALIQGLIEEVDAAEQHKQELSTDERELNASQSTFTPSQGNFDPFSQPPSVGIQTGKTLDAGAITLGSRQPPLKLHCLESLQDQGSLFYNFRTRLSAWLTAMFKAYHYKFQPGCDRVELQDTDMVSTTFGYTGRVGS